MNGGVRILGSHSKLWVTDLLDGDLVREIHHDRDPSDPTASHEEWGLISKNGLAVVSGLYYWTVESDDGTVQMGKLAIIL